MYKDDKFFNFVFTKIDEIKILIKKQKATKNKEKKKQLEDEIDSLNQQLANILLGKMKIMWQEIEAMPDSEEKNYEIFKYEALVCDLENIIGITEE